MTFKPSQESLDTVTAMAHLTEQAEFRKRRKGYPCDDDQPRGNTCTERGFV